MRHACGYHGSSIHYFGLDIFEYLQVNLLEGTEHWK